MIVVREATPGDRAYVLSTWVESEEAHTPWQPDRDLAFAALRGKAYALLARSRVVIAAPEDDAITVLAWLAVDRERGQLVHYAYTRRTLRRQGLQSDLLRAAHIEGRPTITTTRPRRMEMLRAIFAPQVGWMLAVASKEAA